MVARIHHRKAGIEYVLQYKSRTDSIELRINRYTLIGGIPNYFRHEWGTYVREMDFFKRAVLNHRPFSGLCLSPYPRPKLSDAEKDALHEFEKIAGVNLLLTPESVSRLPHVRNGRESTVTGDRYDINRFIPKQDYGFTDELNDDWRIAWLRILL